MKYRLCTWEEWRRLNCSIPYRSNSLESWKYVAFENRAAFADDGIYPADVAKQQFVIVETERSTQ